MWTEAQRELVICLKSSTAAKRWPMLQFVFHSAVAVGRTCFLSCHMCLNWSSKTLITEEVGFSVEVGERIGKGDRKSWKCRWSPGCSLRLKLGWTWGTTNCYAILIPPSIRVDSTGSRAQSPSDCPHCRPKLGVPRITVLLTNRLQMWEFLQPPDSIIC